MGNVADDHPAHAFRVVDAESEGDPAAPVVGEDVGALDAEGVEQGDGVAGQRLAVVAAVGRLRPPEAAEIGGDETVGVAQGGNDPAPEVVMLGPAVEKEDGVAGSGLLEVDPQAAGDDLA